MHAAAHHLRETLADGKTKPGSALIAASCFICTIKAFENTRQMFFLYPDAIVTDFNEYMEIVGTINARNNVSIGFSILAGVLNEINKHLPDLFFIRKKQLQEPRILF